MIRKLSSGEYRLYSRKPEGVADVRIIEALYRSAQRGRPVKIEPLRMKRPSMKQTKYRPSVEKPSLVHAESAAL